MGSGFRSLWASTGAANLGDGMVVVLLPLLALSTGASPAGVAAVTAAATLAWPILGLHAGWVVDRANRRALLVTVNVIRAAALGVVVVATASDTLSLPLVLAVALVYGSAETLVDTALTATVPLVVGPADRGRANAQIEGTINLTNQLAGPPAAGFLAGVAMTMATAVSGGLYAIAAVLAATLRIRQHTDSDRPAPDPATVDVRVRAGIIFLWRHDALRFLTVITAAMNVVWAVWTALFVVVAVDPGPLRLTTGQYGLVLTGMAVGGLAAAMLVEPLRRRFGARAVLIADVVGTIALVAPIAVGAPAWITVIGVVIAGSGSSVWRIIVATIRQNVTPLEQLGRVYAAHRVLSWGVIPVSAALAGVAAELTSVRAVFAGATVLAVVVAVVFVVSSRRFDLTAAASSPQFVDV